MDHGIGHLHCEALCTLDVWLGRLVWLSDGDYAFKEKNIQGLIFGTTLIPALWNNATMPLKSGYLVLFMWNTYRLPSSPTV
jgi:hypothetical protein